jgi:hypothetical protein
MQVEWFSDGADGSSQCHLLSEGDFGWDDCEWPGVFLLPQALVVWESRCSYLVGMLFSF